MSAAQAAAGIGLGVWSLFPTYLRGNVPNSSDIGLVLLHVIPLVAWAAAIVALLGSGRESARVGAGLLAGSVVVASGLDVAALGQLLSEHLHGGLGFWLSLGSDGAALLAALVSTVALARTRPEPLGPPRPGLVALPLVVGAAAAGVGYSFGWRRYHIVSTVLHTSSNRTIASVFDDKALVILGSAIALAGITVVPLGAAWWTRRRGTGAVVLGAVVGLGGYVALNVREVVGAASFGFSPLLVHRYGIHLHAELTAWFVVAMAGLGVLTVTGAVLVVRGGQRGD